MTMKIKNNPKIVVEIKLCTSKPGFLVCWPCKNNSSNASKLIYSYSMILPIECDGVGADILSSTSGG